MHDASVQQKVTAVMEPIICSSRGVVFRPSPQLRWVFKVEQFSLDIGDTVTTRQLQQAWLGDDGSLEWRAVEHTEMPAGEYDAMIAAQNERKACQ